MAIFPDELRDQHTSEGLLRAARQQNIVFKRTLDSDGWLLCAVVNVGIFDNKSDVDVSFLEEDRPIGRFRYEGTSPFLKPKSVIAYKGDRVSLPDGGSLERTIVPVKWLR